MSFARVLPLLCSFLLAAPAAAQLPGGGSEPQPAGGRPGSTRVGPMETLEGIGEAFTDLFRRSEDRDVDDPRWDSTDGPRATVMTFTAAMEHVALGRERAWPRALRTLPADAEEPRAAARALADVFARLPELAPSSVPSADKADRERIDRWELFPRGMDSAWAYQALGEAPDGEIVLVRTGGGWRFSPETVRGAADLAESMAKIPPRPRGGVRGAVFAQTIQPAFVDSPWWAWLCAVAGLAAGVAAAWAAAKALRWVADRADEGPVGKLGGSVLGSILRGLAVPLGLALAVAGLLAGTGPLALTPTLENFRWRIAELLLVVAGVWLVVNLFELLVVGVRRLAADDEDHYSRMSASVLRRAVRFAAAVVLGLFVVQNLFSWDVTAIVGGTALVALALSLAAKDAVANLFGGAMIFLTRPFLVGDWVSFDGRWGQVADVSLQATRIRLLTGELWSVPNSNFVDKPVENLSLRKYLRRVMEVRLPLDTPAGKIREALEIVRGVLTDDAVVGDGRGDLHEHPPKVNLEGFGEWSVNLRADYWYLMTADESSPQRDVERGWFSYLEHQTTVNRLVKERLEAAGLSLALPAQVLHRGEDVGAG